MIMPLSTDFQPPALRGPWSALPTDVPEGFKHAVETYAQYWRAPSTLKRRYTSWRKIIRLSMEHDVCPMPMTSGVARGILAHVAEGGASYSELCAIRDCISFVHKYKDLPDPTKSHAFARVWAGIKRKTGCKHPNRKIALTRPEVGAMMKLALKNGREDHAVAMAVAFEGATRVSELCSLTVDDLLANAETIFVSCSKTDQYRVGADVTFEHRVGALNAKKLVLGWAHNLGRDSGPLLSPIRNGADSGKPLNSRAFTRFAKMYAAQIGIAPRLVGSHSFRAGWITEELKLGRPQADVAAHARHSDLSSLMIYYRPRTEPPNYVVHAKSGRVA